MTEITRYDMIEGKTYTYINKTKKEKYICTLTNKSTFEAILRYSGGLISPTMTFINSAEPGGYWAESSDEDLAEVL